MVLSCGDPLAYARPVSGEVLVDLGCGRGNDLKRAAHLVGPGGRVVGFDVTLEMVSACRARLSEQGLSNFLVAVASMEDLPLEGESVDVVISNCAVNHSRDKLRVFGEVFRILKDGGRFAFSEPASLSGLPAALRQDPQAWADCFAGAETEEHYRSLAAGAGFTDVRVTRTRTYVKRGFPFASAIIEGRRVRG